MNSFDLFGNSSDETASSIGQSEDPLSYAQPLEGVGDTLEDEVREPRSFAGIITAGIFISAVLAAQCFKLQVSNAASNQAKADQNTLRLITVSASRGLIVDTNGTVLAQNSSQLALAIDPQTLPVTTAGRAAVYKLLQDKAGLTPAEITALDKKRLVTAGQPFVIQQNLTKDESLLYKQWFATTPGVEVMDEPSRLYASMPSLGQLIGFTGQPENQTTDTGTEAVGKTGLEEQYNTQLSGTTGKEQAEVNAQGQVVHTISTAQSSLPVAGETLKLNIDSKLQAVVAQALEDELARRTAKFGEQDQFGASAVVMNPNTGAVLAMVSLPDYNDQLFADGISQADYQSILSNPGNPLLNRATQGQYPPGSTIKPLIAAAGLQAGVITANTQMVTPDAIYVGNYRFPDWETHGQTDTEKAIAQSNDIFFYAVGGGWTEGGIPNGLGIDRENQYLSDFGLGSKTGIDLPGEESGLLADNAWKKATTGQSWYIGDTYHASIGQGYTLATPLQMASSTAAVVNGGTVYQPELAKGFIDSSGKETDIAPVATKTGFISSETAATVRAGMRETVTGGTGWKGSAWPLAGLTVTSAGKTGSAQFGPNNTYEDAWYTGFAPYDNPQIVFSIMIENGGESFYSSVPVAEEILRGYFNEPLAPGQNLLSDTQVPSGYQGEH